MLDKYTLITITIIIIKIMKGVKKLASIKYSRQRESIRKFLISRKDHPSADTIYDNVRKEDPKISLATVYRNLTLLEELGEVMRIRVEGGADRFDGNADPHNHFICTRCQSVIDLEMDNIDFIKDVAAKNFDGIIERYVTNFYGLCGRCKEREDKKMHL